MLGCAAGSEAKLLLDVLRQQFGVDFVHRHLGRPAAFIFPWRHRLLWRAISLWFDPNDFRQRLNCLASHLGDGVYFLLRAINIC